VAEVIGAFDRKIAPMCSEEHRRRALYAVAATFDDVAQNLPGQSADGAEWARRSMVVRFFNENIGGDRFWQIVEDMLKRPAEYGLLIELYHACLAAGFEGRFRVLPDGRRRLDEVMTQLYATLEHPRALSQVELSPHWRGEASPIRKVGFWTPLLAAGGAALGLLLVIYVVLRLVLGQTGLPAAQALSAINPDERLRLSRAAAAAQVPAGAQAIRLKQFLAPEIRQGLVVVEEDPSTVRVRTTVGDLFRSGSDQLEPGRRALFERIGSAVDTEPGPVRVEGHADSDRVSGLTFPDNMALSAARARTVSAILRGRLAEPGRVVAEGFGDSVPLASNETARGKALNRRVEIVVPRAAGP
jgi:type VI secretion system protein ImpK